MTPKRVLIATDAWKPQTNGVVTAIEKIQTELQARGIEVLILHPEMGFTSLPLPWDPEVKLPLFAYKNICKRIKEFSPDAIHVASVAVISSHVRKFCLKNSIPFTASYHSQFPEYITERYPWISPELGYFLMRRFYNAADCTMIATESMRARLENKGLTNLKLWPLGVDLNLFHPRKRMGISFQNLPKPIWLNVGRLAIEKNMEAFCSLKLPGTKVSIGYGPQMEQLMRKYPEVQFLGPKYGEELAQHMADADVFVFPSLTDTLGLVNLEAMASGTPVAAFPVPGPIDILSGTKAGVLGENLQQACEQALSLSRGEVRKVAEKYSWEISASEFLKNLSKFD